MEQKIVIEWHLTGENGQSASPEHRDELQESVYDRIFSMMSRGYNSGELIAHAGDDQHEYSGWWEAKATEITESTDFNPYTDPEIKQMLERAGIATYKYR